MVHNMSIQKEENNGPFKPQTHQKNTRGQNRQNFDNRDRIDHTVERDKDKSLEL